MTLLENKVSEWNREFIEGYQREEHRRTFENPELDQTESGFHEIVSERDSYCSLRFLRK